MRESGRREWEEENREKERGMEKEREMKTGNGQHVTGSSQGFEC